MDKEELLELAYIKVAQARSYFKRQARSRSRMKPRH
jgi:hypothetical protein